MNGSCRCARRSTLWNFRRSKYTHSLAVAFDAGALRFEDGRDCTESLVWYAFRLAATR
jgi:hypothetical protein